MATTRLMTAEDLWQMAEVDCRYELDRGDLVRIPFSGEEHGALGFDLMGLLANYLATSRIGEGFSAGTGFILERNPDTVRAPDAAVVRFDRLPPEEDQIGFLELAPDLAVEIISPSDGACDMNYKVMQYLNSGVQTVWLVYPRSRTVIVYTSDRTGRILTASDVLDGGDVLPGFRVPVREIFGYGARPLPIKPPAFLHR